MKNENEAFKEHKVWAKITKTTDRAIRVIQHNPYTGVWLPLSQITLMEEQDGYVEILIPDWLFQTKELSEFFTPETAEQAIENARVVLRMPEPFIRWPVWDEDEDEYAPPPN